MDKDNINISDELLLSELKKRFDAHNKSIKELGELNFKLKEINKKLVQSEAMKSHFLSNMSNEIINPFSSIIGLSKIISQENDIEKIKTHSALLYDEVQTLDFQFKNIFWAAQLEAGKIEFFSSEFEIDKLILDSLKNTAYQAKKMKINFEFQHSNEKITTDKQKLEIVLDNIFDNAIKFSEPEQKVNIWVENDNKNIIINIKDFGIGIEKKYFNIIFDRFKKINQSIYTDNKGQGLGLSIAKEIIELLYGKIELESNINKGSTFSIILPKIFPEKNTSGNIYEDGIELF